MQLKQLKDYVGATDPDYLNLLATLAQIKSNSKRVVDQLQNLDKRIGDSSEIEIVSIEIEKGKPLTRREFKALKTKYEFTSDLMLRSLLDTVENAYSKDFDLESLTKIATRIKTKYPRTADPTQGSCGNCQNWRLLPYFDIDNPDVVEGECQVLEVEGNHLLTKASFACAKWRLLIDE